jgi:hypothetical protein
MSPLGATWISIQPQLTAHPVAQQFASETLHQLWTARQARRQADAREAFQQMLHENQFIDFWTKKGSLAPQDIHALLQDARYIALDYGPAERDRLLQEHVQHIRSQVTTATGQEQYEEFPQLTWDDE